MENVALLELIKGAKGLKSYPFPLNGSLNLTLEKMGAIVLPGLDKSIVGLLSTENLNFNYLADDDPASPATLESIAEYLEPKRITGVVNIPNTLLHTFTPAANEKVYSMILEAIDAIMFKAAIAGDGVAEPEGLFTTITTNINTTAGAPTWDIVTELEGKVRNEISHPKNLNYVSGVDLFMNSKTIKKDANSGIFLCEENKMNGYNYEASNLIPATDSGASFPLVFGDWSEMTIGVFGINVIIDPYSLSSTSMTRIIIDVYNDIKITNEKAFAIANKLIV